MAASLGNSKICIVHISDVHVGITLENHQFSYLWPWSKLSAHSYQLTQALVPALAHVRSLTRLPSGEPLHLLVSGDLTTVGEDREFNNAEDVLLELAQFAGGPVASLTVLRRYPRLRSAPNLWTIPGNHDQWGGSAWSMDGYNAALAGLRFAACPWLRSLRSGRLELELAALDSNAGMAGASNRRAFGSLDLSQGGEVDRLEQDLNTSDANGPPAGVDVRIRAVALHHSPSFSSSVSHTLDDASRRRLLLLADRFDLVACFTGHIHRFGPVPSNDPDNPMSTPKGRKFWDLRSASTIQGPPDRTNPRPGFYAHKIWADDQHKPHWHAWRYEWSVGDSAFLPADDRNPDVQVLP
jgi:3',5'-cyclic AMP phosphodiesterase CpdA